MHTSTLLPNLFRTEYSKMVAVLCKSFGLSNMQIAEDIVSDTFLLAAETWGKKGIPDNQAGWLYTVAKNRTKDYLKREKIKQEKVEPNIQMGQTETYQMDTDFSEKSITDSQLQMIFAICHPSIPTEAQIALGLRVLCGFGIDEISSALLSNKETINKKLYRAKANLRKNDIELVFPENTEIEERLDNVLTTIYLLFNEGYYSSSKDQVLSKDLCLEAMRLCLLLMNDNRTALPKVFALLALMCFHASRFESRKNAQGELILYYDQDRNLWNEELILRGEYYLNRSAEGKQMSKYHLEAAIAFWHSRKEDHPEKWEKILQLYNQLLQIEYSPIAALNRTYALAKANSIDAAIQEAEQFNLTKSHLYHCLMAELYQSQDQQKAMQHLEKALNLVRSEEERSVVLGLRNRVAVMGS
ncbi:MAG: DUF6596 domain-containing protein [Bacteroidota bacterium]